MFLAVTGPSWHLLAPTNSVSFLTVPEVRYLRQYEKDTTSVSVASLQACLVTHNLNVRHRHAALNETSDECQPQRLVLVLVLLVVLVVLGVVVVVVGCWLLLFVGCWLLVVGCCCVVQKTHRNHQPSQCWSIIVPARHRPVHRLKSQLATPYRCRPLGWRLWWDRCHQLPAWSVSELELEH